MASGPVSTAVTPPVRNLMYPEGARCCSDLQKEKNLRGNDVLKFVLRAVEAAIDSETKFFVENPDGSSIWRQRDELSWGRVNKLGGLDDFRTDYCRFGTAWRKRTKFRTTLHIGGQKVMCKCSKPHIKLRGRCKEKGCNYTQLAEPYPRKLCQLLAAAFAIDCGFWTGHRPLDVAGRARLSALQAGEAKNPGPRRAAPPRPQGGLEDVQLLEPVTVALRNKLWKVFVDWFAANVDVGGEDSSEWAFRSPQAFGAVMVAYGHALYDAGSSLQTTPSPCAEAPRSGEAFSVGSVGGSNEVSRAG